MEEDIKNLKRLLKSLKRVQNSLNSVNSGAYEEFLEQPLTEAEDEITLRIEEMTEDMDAAMRGFDE